MAYLMDPDPVRTANAAAYIALLQAESATASQLGGYLDASFDAVWNPPAPATVQGVVALCGTNFLARCELHYSMACILLQQEAANGISSSKHSWAKQQQDGSYLPGVPSGWSYTPIIENGQPTGAAEVVYTEPIAPTE